MNRTRFTARDGKQFYCPTGLNAITLEQFINLMVLEKEMPSVLKAAVDAKTTEERVRMLEAIPAKTDAREVIPYKARVVSLLCRMPLDTILSTDPEKASLAVEDINLLYANCMHAFSKFKVDKDFKGFTFEGVRYVMPKKFMEGSTFIEYVESAQYQAFNAELEAGAWGALPFVIAILARPEGEHYDEQKTMLRGEKFKQLDLEIALNVNFFLIRLSVKLNEDSLFYLLADRLAQSKRELVN